MEPKPATFTLYLQCPLAAARKAFSERLHDHLCSGVLRDTDPADETATVRDMAAQYPYTNSGGPAIPFNAWWKTIAVPMLSAGASLGLDIRADGVVAGFEVLHPWGGDGATVSLDESRFDTDAAKKLEAVREAIR